MKAHDKWEEMKIVEATKVLGPIELIQTEGGTVASLCKSWSALLVVLAADRCHSTFPHEQLLPNLHSSTMAALPAEVTLHPGRCQLLQGLVKSMSTLMYTFRRLPPSGRSCLLIADIAPPAERRDSAATGELWMHSQVC